MNLLISRQDEVVIAMPSERLDTSTSPEAEKGLMAQIEAGETKIVIDFSKTAYISSAGLRVLLKIAKTLKQKGGTFALCNANEQIHDVLEISGFMSMLTYCDALEDAVAKVST